MSDDSTEKSIVPFKDPLNDAISLKASLPASGVEGAAQSRTLAALDNLCGAMIESAGGAWLDGFRRRQRARDAVEERVIYEEGEARIEDIRADRAAARFERDLLRKQEAREVVGQVAFSEVKRLPAPKDSETSTESTLDDGWMNAFSAFAENATEEGLRVLWGRVLAGEIKSPGAFARSTLRTISELDVNAARAFGAIMPLRLPEGYLPRLKVIEAGINIRVLEDAGLVQHREMGVLGREHEGAGYWISDEWLLRIDYKGSDQNAAAFKFTPMF